MITFRTLEPEDIEIRIDRITEYGVALLMYKNARVDMAILDDSVGAANWQRRHVVINDNLFCEVGIYDDEKQQWIWKQDVGTESYTEKEKGEASDSFKRACSCWGIGRELYSAPDIFVKCATDENGKGGYKLTKESAKMFKDMRVAAISYTDNRKIKDFAIVDKSGNAIYSNMGTPKKPIDPKFEKKEKTPDSKIEPKDLEALKTRIKNVGYTEKVVCEAYGLKTLSDMTESQFITCNEKLSHYEEEKKKAAKK